MPRPRRVRPIILRVDEPIVHPVAAKKGDWIMIEPGAERPVILLRDLPANYGALLGHLVNGALSSPDDADQVLARLQELVKLQTPPRPRNRRQSA